MTCTIPDCENPVRVKSSGLCSKHYSRLTRYGEVTARQASGVPIDYVGDVTCRLCNTTRPHTEFYRRGNRRRTECIPCIKAKAQASSERVEFADERWARRRDGTLRRKYGIGQTEFDEMLTAQGGRCAICREVPVNRRSNTRTGRTWAALVVDHDHVTGAVRGLLCLPCNTVLGRVETVGVDRFLTYLGK